MKIIKNLKGTSLIEVLIVATILVILSTIGIMSYRDARAKARDAKRKYDVRSVSLALQIYYDEEGAYPICSCVGGEPISDCWNNDENNDLIHYLVEEPEKPYIAPMPEDPLNKAIDDFVYKYCSDDGKEYIINYKVEQEENIIELWGY